MFDILRKNLRVNYPFLRMQNIALVYFINILHSWGMIYYNIYNVALETTNCLRPCSERLFA
jgi:hypothetical protein